MKKSAAGILAASLFLLLTGTLVTVLATGGFDRRPEPPPATDVAADAPRAEESGTTPPAVPTDPEADDAPPPDAVARVRIVDADGHPVEGASVELLSDPKELRGTYPADVVGEVVTDANGRADFPVDPLTRYMLRVSKPGYAIAGDVACFGGNVTAFRLSRGGSVAGTVRDAETGRPIEAALVYVMDWSSVGIVAEWTATTDSDGRYRVDGIGDGLLNIHARAADRPVTMPEHEVRVVEGKVTAVDFELPRGRKVVLHVLDAETGKPVREVTVDTGRGSPVVGSGERIETAPLPAEGPAAVTVAAGGYLPSTLLFLEADISAEGPREVRLHRGSVVTGVVRTASGEVVPGMRVRISVRDTDPLVMTTIEAVTDADGTFRVRGASPGGAILWEVLRNGRPFRIGNWCDVPEMPGEFALEPIVLEETATVRGQVFDPEGNPIPYGYVAAYRPDDRGTPPRTESFVDPRGRFRLTDVPLGRVLFVLGAVEEWPKQTFEVEVKEGAEITWRLDRGYEISGRVVDAEGRPVSKKWVALTAGGSIVRTDDAGRFRIRGLGPGPHRIFLGWSRTPAATEIAGNTYDLEIVAD
jgi:protocatechuate 3,4-dioxygenase beta subunit